MSSMSSPAAQQRGLGSNWPGPPSPLPLGQCPSGYSSILSNEAATRGLVRGVEPSGSSGRWEERPGLSLSAPTSTILYLSPQTIQAPTHPTLQEPLELTG